MPRSSIARSVTRGTTSTAAEQTQISIQNQSPAAKILRFSAAAAKIHEIHHFQEITSHIDSGTTIVLDIDNTIAEPGNGNKRQILGSDQWFYAHMEREKAKGKSFDEALHITLRHYDKIHEISTVKPVEEQTPQIISDLQRRGVNILALTTRGGNIADATIRQLAGVNVNFNHGRFKDKAFSLSQSSISKAKQGIIFCGGKHKGECLNEYLSLLKFRPSKILFVDDKLSNIHQVQDTARRMRVPCVGLRCTHLDEHLHVDLDVADVQLEKLGSILTDEEARTLAISRKKPRLSS